MYLIINADDFGLTKALNLGILETIKNGVVTGTTAMANKPAFAHAAEIGIKEKLDIGLHLTLSTGRPVTGSINSLTDDDGNFHNLSYLSESFSELLPCEIEGEFLAQIIKAENAGLKISHLDSHHHVHTLPIIKEVFLNIAKKLDLPVRNGMDNKNIKAPELDTSFYKEGASLSNFKNIVDNFKGEVLEIMVHPAYLDEDLFNESSYCRDRAHELAVLTSDEIKNYIKEKNIKLINFSEFKNL